MSKSPAGEFSTLVLTFGQNSISLVRDSQLAINVPLALGPQQLTRVKHSHEVLRIVESRLFAVNGARFFELLAEHAAALQEVGDALGDLLPVEIRSSLETLELEASRTQHRIPFAIRVLNENKLLSGMEIVWEALTIGAHPIALHPSLEMYRLYSSSEVDPPLTLPRPLKVLAALAQPIESDVDELAQDAEMLILHLSLAARHFDSELTHVLASLEAIEFALSFQRPTILHLSSHGAAGQLLLEDWDGYSRPVKSDELVASLTKEYIPPVVVLSSCFSASGDIPIATELLRAGVTGVVAMRSEVGDETATVFVGSLYQALATGSATTLLEAFAAARSVYSVSNTFWATPTLHMRTDIAFEPPRDVDLLATRESHLFEEFYEPIKRATAVDPRDYVQRPQLERAIRNFFLGQHSSMVLYGLAGSGKSSVVLKTINSLVHTFDFVVFMSGLLSSDECLLKISEALRHPRVELNESTDALATNLSQQLSDKALSLEDRLRCLTQLDGQGGRELRLNILWDDFEENLIPTRGQVVEIRHRVDPSLEELITVLSRASQGGVRLLIVSRYQFSGDEPLSETLLAGFGVGPLSEAGARRLLRGSNSQVSATQIEKLFLEAGRSPGILSFVKENLRELTNPEGSDFDSLISKSIRRLVDQVELDSLLDSIGPLTLALVTAMSVFRVPFLLDQADAFMLNPSQSLPEEDLVRLNLALDRSELSEAQSPLFDDGRSYFWSDDGLTVEDLNLHPWIVLTHLGRIAIIREAFHTGLFAPEPGPINDEETRWLVPRWVARHLEVRDALGVRKGHEFATRMYSQPRYSL